MAKLKELKKVRNKQFLRHLEDGADGDEEEVQEHDSNAELIQPLSKEEKELKKRKLELLFTPEETKTSRTKKKRLDKFIEHQLKKEEKKTIIEKLQDYKVDTSLLTSSKKLGHGRQTKKEEFAEALALEKQGRGNEYTKDILYEEREARDWDEDHPESDEVSGAGENDTDFMAQFGDTSETKTSSFIDNRPSKFGGAGFGFGFANAKVISKEKTVSKRKYNWRQRIEREERRKHKTEDEIDFESSSEGEDEEEEEEEEGDNCHEAVEDSDEVDLDISKEGDDSLGEDHSSDEENEEDSEPEETSDEETSDEEPNAKSEKLKITKVAEDFKSWANQEIKKMEGRDVDLATPKLNVDYQPLIRSEDLEDGLKEDYVPINEKSQRQAFFVEVERPDTIQKARIQLPVFGEEHRIMEAIHHNDTVILCGETGSGKTTQVPQFLYESGYGHPESPDNPGMIGITQPRRVAAVSMARRVSQELGDHGDKVAYQIRFDSTTKDTTRMKFMTDGVLLREMMNDFRLTKYSSIIIDEAHERNINTDILIGMLSRCVMLRAKEHSEDPIKNKKLKLIIMSATLRVSDFSENTILFPTPPPVLKIEARQYPVSIHFNRRTAFNYTEEAFRKTCKIHSKLPPGAILVFLTGQQEITHMVKKLRKEFPFPKNSSRRKEMESTIPTMKINSKNADIEAEDIDFSVKVIDEEKFDDNIDGLEDEDTDDEEGFEESLEEGQTANDPLYVLPLYSLLPTKEQMKVFQAPPAGSRLCVVATNVAETSLTIPNVRYVVDCGRSKERKYNESNNVQSFEVDWISKASAGQRSGRAGRTGPGHCYRLYSSAVYEDNFAQFSRPEILRMPVESVVLQMKSMAVHNIVNFPFPTPPERFALAKAIKLLQCLGALDEKEKITDDGKKMSLFPLSPRFSKMLLVGDEQNCLPYIVSIVSSLSVGDPFINEHELGLTNNNDSDSEDGDNFLDDELKRNMRTKFYKSRSKFCKLDKYSDVLRFLSAVSALDYIPVNKRAEFMTNNFLRHKLIEETIKLRKQIMYIIKSNTSKESVAVSVKDEDLRSGVPNETQVKLLKQMVCAGFVDQVAVRADQIFPEDAKITNKASIINIPYVPVLAERSSNVAENFVYIHPTSIMNNLGEEPPKYLVFHSLHLNSNTDKPKTRMKPLCDIKSTPLANIARKGSLLCYSKPLTGQGIKPIQISPTERYCYVVPRFGATIDSDLKIGWELNPVAVHQKKEQGKWIVTKFITGKTYKSLEVQKKN